MLQFSGSGQVSSLLGPQDDGTSKELSQGF